jgi:hypothetical protein
MKVRRRHSAPVPQPADPRPTEVTDRYWLHAGRKTGAYPASTEKSGKWLIFVPVAQINDVWAKIKLATEQGRLGYAAKVATARPNPNARNPEAKVICVYTYDWSDETDVRRVRRELRALGILSKISYKADEDTLAGRYAIRGNKRISMYYE